MKALVTALANDPPQSIIFGTLEDKAWREMLEILKPWDCERFYVKPQGRAPADPEALAAVLPGKPMASLEAALEAASGTVLICGSLYLVGEARARLLGLPIDPFVAL
jgi:dihydrofolate synthase/folylpolyglutamate synthase